jgi:hypothetical protein
MRSRKLSLDRERLFEHFASLRHYGFPPEEEDVALYMNELTGVHFRFLYDADEEWPLTFELNVLRPHTFALEADGELSALTDELELEVNDVQEEGIVGEVYDGAQFLRGWNHLNRFAYQNRDPANAALLTLPTAELERCWRWNIDYDRLVEVCGEHYFIANIGFLEMSPGHVVTFAWWPDDQPILLPPVDQVLLTRGDGAARLRRLVSLGELRARIPALCGEPEGDEEGPHWALVGLEIGDRLQSFFASRPNDELRVLEPAHVHAVESVRPLASSPGS